MPDWAITGNPAWLAVSSAASSKNKNVVVTADEKTSTMELSCELHIATDDRQAMAFVHVKQSTTAESLSVDVTEIDLDGNINSSGSIHVTSNTNWTISGVPNWPTLSSVTGNSSAQVTVTANTANNTSSNRECRLFISTGAIANPVKVVQADF